MLRGGRPNDAPTPSVSAVATHGLFAIRLERRYARLSAAYLTINLRIKFA